MPVILALQRWRSEDDKFRAIFSDTGVCGQPDLQLNSRHHRLRDTLRVGAYNLSSGGWGRGLIVQTSRGSLDPVLNFEEVERATGIELSDSAGFNPRITKKSQRNWVRQEAQGRMTIKLMVWEGKQSCVQPHSGDLKNYLRMAPPFWEADVILSRWGPGIAFYHDSLGGSDGRAAKDLGARSCKTWDDFFFIILGAIETIEEFLSRVGKSHLANLAKMDPVVKKEGMVSEIEPVGKSGGWVLAPMASWVLDSLRARNLVLSCLP